MGHIHGVVVGTVKRVDDPNGEGRILVDFPWMGGKNQSYWAPVATLMSGNGHGSWFMPEVDDEVLVAFDHEDVDHPYILGFLWNGKDKPPETSSHKRLIKSVKGHTILLDDTDGSEKIEITTGGGLERLNKPVKRHTILLDDTEGSEKIEITTGGGLKITMDDVSNTITIKATDTVTVDVGAKGIINLGVAASQKAVLGNDLLVYLNQLYTAILTHVHTEQLALGIFPVIGLPGILPPPPPPPPALLSNMVNLE